MSKTLDQINKFLQDKDNQKYHFNNFEEEDYKVSSGSLNLDLALGGGFPQELIVLQELMKEEKLAAH